MTIYRNYYREGCPEPTNFMLLEDEGLWRCTHGGWDGCEVGGEPTHLKHGYGVAKYASFEQYEVDSTRKGQKDCLDFDEDIPF